MLSRWWGRRAAPDARESGGADYDLAPDLAGRRRFLDGHILIHTHVPKTAGATLAAGLSAIVGGVRTMDLRLRRSIPLDRLDHAELAELSLVTGHFPYGLHARFDRSPLYFAAVREPADRAVSSYRFLSSHPDQPGHEEVTGCDFETWESRHRERQPNEQSRMLGGNGHGAAPDAAQIIAHVDAAYLLVIPQPEMTRAIQALRAAFGVSWTRIARANVSHGHEVELDSVTREAIRRANAVDAALYAHVLETFDDRLARACDYIAEHCLAPPADAGDESAPED
jgi:Sulfotransferase family